MHRPRHSTREEWEPEVEQSERHDRGGSLRCAHAVRHEQGAERRVGHAETTGQGADQRRHQGEGVDEQRGRQAEVHAEAAQHEEQAGEAEQLPADRGEHEGERGAGFAAQAAERVGEFGGGGRRPRRGGGTADQAAATVGDCPGDAGATASSNERREATRTTPIPTTRAYPAEAMAPNNAVPWSPPVTAARRRP